MLTVMLCVAMVIVPTKKSHAIVWVVVKAAAKKVIKAMDLAVQRQQNKVIWLQNAQKAIENTMSKLKLDEISAWTEKQRQQYKKYFAELQQVKLWITYYQRIKEIAKKQTRLVREYQRAWGMVRSDKHFTPDEIEYMGKVYTGILTETLNNIDQISMVIKSFQTNMSDAKRLEIINHAANKVDENYGDLIQFNYQNGLLSLQRAEEESEISVIKQMYGIKD